MKHDNDNEIAEFIKRYWGQMLLASTFLPRKPQENPFAGATLEPWQSWIGVIATLGFVVFDPWGFNFPESLAGWVFYILYLMFVCMTFAFGWPLVLMGYILYLLLPLL